MTQPAEELHPLVPWSAALAAAYAAAMARIKATLLALLSRQWRQSGSWRDADAERFVRTMVPAVQAAQRAVATTTSAYLNQLTAQMTGTVRPPITVPAAQVTGSAVRNGARPEAVYRRPFETTWTELAADTPLDIAVDMGEARARTIAATDLQLTKTHTAKQVFAKDPRVVGYRRVPQGDHTCALCLIVSTRRYHKKELAALHPNCDCDIEPIHGEFDPGPVLDEAFLNAVHDAIKRDLGAKYVAASGKAKNTRARELDYRDIVIVHQHGEVGPVLGVRGQHFTGPADIRRLTHKKIQP